MSISLKEFYEPNNENNKKEIIYNFLEKNKRAYTISEIVNQTKIKRSIISHHLRKLRLKDKKVVMKEINRIFYYAVKQKK